MSISVSFSSDGLEIRGNLHLVEEDSPCVVTLHGLLGDKDRGKWPSVSSRLCDSGYSCLRFNFRGCGSGEEKSDGNFEDITLSARIRDFKFALNWLGREESVDMNRIGVIGSSLGGMVAIATKDDRLKTKVTMGSPYKIPRYDEPRIPEKRGKYYVLPSGERFKDDFYEDISQYNLLEDIRESPPILIVQGDSDEIVLVEHARKLYDHATEPKKLEIVRDADHSFSDSESLDKAMDAALKWFDKYL